MAEQDTATDDGIDGARVLHQARVNAWFATKMEFDKTLLGLSTFGLGLWRFLLESLSDAPTWIRACHGGMAVSFLATVVFCLLIFSRNPGVLEATIRGDEDEIRRENGKVRPLDIAAIVFFGIALALFVVVGLYVTWGPTGGG